MGTVAEVRLPNHALEVEGPRIQFDSTMSVEVSSGEKCSTSSTDKCKHFTIRGFVSHIRSKDNKIYSPFVSDGEANSGNENNLKLPHMQVLSFRRWKCNRCLDQDVDSSQGTTSTAAAAVASRSPRSDYDESKIFPSRRPSKKRSTSNETHDLHMVGSSSQTVRTEVKDTAKGKSHMKEGLMAPPSILVNGKGMRSLSQKSPRRHFLQEHCYSRERFDGHLNRENYSLLQFSKEGYSREVGSSSQGTSPAMTPLLSNAISCGNLSSSGQKLENYSSLRIPMARLNGFTKEKSTSQKPASLQGASIEVSFSPTNIPGDGKSSSLKLSQDRPGPKSGFDQGTSRGSVMGPPRSYPHGKNCSSQKKPKESGLQIGKRHYAKRTMQPQDNAEGRGVVSKDPSVQKVLLPSAVTQEEDHVQESVSPKSKRTIEVGSKGKGVANISSDSRSKVMLAKINQPASDAPSLFGTCRDGKAETCTEVAKTIGPHNMLTEHSVPSLVESNSGGSTSGHVDDDDDDDDNDEDYEEEDEGDESRRRLRPRRAPKIISLKKVMDKADLQNAQSTMKVGAKNRKRKNRSQDMVYPGLRNSNDSPSSGSKRIATRDIRRENINTSQKRDVIKRTLDKSDPEKKNKKLKPNKSYVSSVSFQEKFELERCHEKGPQKKRTSKDKAEGSNKRRGKRKADVPGTRDRSPTSSKGMQSGDGETEIELRKVVHPDSMNLVSQGTEKILEENTAENTTSSLTVRGDGGDKAMRKGKEKLVEVVEFAENSVLHLRGSGEGSSSLANDESRQADGRGKVKDFDINVPAEEVLMDIVELMAKNQLERTRDDVVDKPIIMQEPNISQSRGFYPTDSMAVYNNRVDRSHPPYGIYVKPPADYPGFGLAKTGPVGSVRQLSEYFVEAHKSTLQVGYPNDNLSSNARFAGSYVPQCPDQVPGQVRYSSVGSVGGGWSHNTLAYKAPDNNILQQGSSFTRYQGGISSSPLNSPTWPPSKPAGIQSQVPVGGGLVNQQMFALESAPFRGPQNDQISGPLNFNLFARDRQKNSTASPYSPDVEAISEHSYGCGKHQMINYLPLKATGPEDFSSNDVIPALQLLNIMHSGQSRSNRPWAAEVNGNRIVSSTSHSVIEPSYHQYSKQYMAGSHRHFEGCLNRSSGSRHLPVYETRGGRSTSSVEKPCPNYANLATHHQPSNSSLFLRDQTSEKKSNAGYANPLSFPSHAQRGRFGNSVQSSSQVVDFRAQKPLNHVLNLDREHQWVPAISKGLTGYGGPSRWSLEALNSLKNQPLPRNGTLARPEQLASLLTPSTEVCVVNRNPAEIIDPREASKFTIKSEDLRHSIAKRTQMVY